MDATAWLSKTSCAPSVLNERFRAMNALMGTVFLFHGDNCTVASTISTAAEAAADLATTTVLYIYRSGHRSTLPDVNEAAAVNVYMSSHARRRREAESHSTVCLTVRTAVKLPLWNRAAFPHG